MPPAAPRLKPLSAAFSGSSFDLDDFGLTADPSGTAPKEDAPKDGTFHHNEQALLAGDRLPLFSLLGKGSRPFCNKSYLAAAFDRRQRPL